jgi:hypothetical protein
MKNIIIYIVILLLIVYFVINNFTFEHFKAKLGINECKKKPDRMWNGKKCVKKLKSINTSRPIVKVALDKNNICSLDINGNVWYADDYNIKKISDWKKVGKQKLTSISLNNGIICGTSKSGRVYCADSYKSEFKKIKSPLFKFVIINNNTIIGLTKKNKVQYLNDYKNPKSKWTTLKTDLKNIRRIDLNNNEIIVSNNKGVINYAPDYKAEPLKWQKINNKMVNKIDLAIDANGDKSIVGLNAKDYLTVIHNFHKNNSKMDTLKSTYLDTSASYGNVCGVDFNNQLHCSKIEK